MNGRPLLSPSPGVANFGWFLAAVLFACLFPETSFAQTDQALPYEAGLRAFQTSLNGPVPFAISLVGIVACGAMLIFGGEISGFMRTMVFIVLVISVIVQASTVVEILGGHDSLVTDVGSSVNQFTRATG